MNKNLYRIIKIKDFDTDALFLDAIGTSIKNGIKIIQVCTEDVSPAKFLELSGKIRELCSFFDTLFIVSSRIDIAMLAEADGVLLTNDDITPLQAKKLAGQNFLTGIELKNGITPVITENTDFVLNFVTKKQTVINSGIPVFTLTNEKDKIFTNEIITY